MIPDCWDPKYKARELPGPPGSPPRHPQHQWLVLAHKDLKGVPTIHVALTVYELMTVVVDMDNDVLASRGQTHRSRADVLKGLLEWNAKELQPGQGPGWSNSVLTVQKVYWRLR